VIVEIGGRYDLQALTNIQLIKLILEPGADTLHRGDDYYLKHVASGKYLTRVHKGAQWYPTLGESADRVKLRIPPNQENPRDRADMPILDGSSIEIVSTEDLVYDGKRCDVLMAWSNPNLYYYYDNYSPKYQNWIVSLVRGSGPVRGGAHVRLINQGYEESGGKALMAPDGSYVTTISERTNDTVWLLEKAPRSPYWK